MNNDVANESNSQYCFGFFLCARLIGKKNFRPTRSLNQSHGHKRQLPLIPCYYLIISKTELRSHLPELILPPDVHPTGNDTWLLSCAGPRAGSDSSLVVLRPFASQRQLHRFCRRRQPASRLGPSTGSLLASLTSACLRSGPSSPPSTTGLFSP